jgi:hypothetical protein
MTSSVVEGQQHQVADVGNRDRTDSGGGDGNPLEQQARSQPHVAAVIVVIARRSVRVHRLDHADLADADVAQLVPDDVLQRVDDRGHGVTPGVSMLRKPMRVVKPLSLRMRWTTVRT